MQIAGKAWRYWTEVEIHRSIDSHPTVGFSSPWDPARREMRNAFRPFSFAPFAIEVGGEKLFTGQLVDVSPDSTADASAVSCSAYSLAAQLERNNLPADRIPFEASGLSLAQIAERLASIWSVGVVMRADCGPAFKRVKTRQRKIDTTVEGDQKVDDFLVELAKQRGLVRTSDAAGDLVFWQSVAPGNPVARLLEGKPGAVTVTPTFNAQDYYSEITGFTSTKRGSAGTKFTERNQRLAGGVLRAYSFKLDDIEKADAQRAVKAKLARMFANAVSYVVSLPGWRTPSGALWEANTTVKLLAPRAMIYRETEFLVRDVFLKQSDDEQTTSLGLVLPGAFSGATPEFLPWEEP